MIHTGNFEIAIPKEFLKPPFKYVDEYDFKFKVQVFYSCEIRGDKMDVYRIAANFIETKNIQWTKVELERYFLDAARNNWESKQTTKVELTQENEILN